MVDVSAVALSGLRASEQRLNVAANNIANADTPGFRAKELQQKADSNGGVSTDVVDIQTPAPEQDNQPAASNVSIDKEIVQAQVATYNFQANLKVLKTSDDLQQSLLDIRA